jgi:hypothetical protein
VDVSRSIVTTYRGDGSGGITRSRGEVSRVARNSGSSGVGSVSSRRSRQHDSEKCT